MLRVGARPGLSGRCALAMSSRPRAVDSETEWNRKLKRLEIDEVVAALTWVQIDQVAVDFG
jgi:hypothetical protein